MKKHKLIVVFIITAVLCTVFFLEGKAPNKTPSAKSNEKNEVVSENKAVQQPEKAESEPIDTKAAQDNTATALPASKEPSSSAPASPAKAESTPSVSEKEETNSIAATKELQTNNGQQGATSAESSSESTEQCILSVRCDTILKNIKKLDPEKAAFVPDSGIIYESRSVHFKKGESVFDVLQREMKADKIHFEFVDTPIYGSAYIEGIGNLYEFDCGERSGWMYRVNGVFPNCGCSTYKLKDGDTVEWLFTCDLGSDIGGGKATGENN